MPKYDLTCHCGRDVSKVLVGVADIADVVCSGCGAMGLMTRSGVGPSAHKVELLDNGVMGRRLERLADAERLHRERVMSADELAGRARIK